MRKGIVITLFLALIAGPFCPVVMAKTLDTGMTMGTHHQSPKTELSLQADHANCLASTTHDASVATFPLFELNGLVCPDIGSSLVLVDNIFSAHSLVRTQEAPNTLDHHCSHKRE